MIERYRALIAATKILETARLEIAREESTDSPVWEMLYNAHEYVRKQAREVLRDEEYF